MEETKSVLFCFIEVRHRFLSCLLRLVCSLLFSSNKRKNGDAEALSCHTREVDRKN